MPAFLALAFTALSAAAIVGVQVGLPRLGRRPRFGWSWLIAAAGGLVGLGMAVWALLQSPGESLSLPWSPGELLPDPPALVLDLPGAVMLVGLLGLCLATTLADVHRSAGQTGGARRSIEQAVALGVCTLAGMAAFSANLPALALGLTALDLAITTIWIAQAATPKEVETIIALLAARMASTGTLVWAMQSAAAASGSVLLSELTPAGRAALLAGMAIRAGLLPPHRPILRIAGLSPAQYSLIGLASLMPTWAAVARTAFAGPADYTAALMILAALVGIAAAVGWIRATQSHIGLPYWCIGMAALVIGAAGRGDAHAALAWGACGAMSGGLLVLAPVRTRIQPIILLLGWLGIAALPFTPAWPGTGLFRPPFFLLLPFYLIIHGLLAAGWGRLALRRTPQIKTAERWVWLVYPLGPALIVGLQMLILWRLRPGAPGALEAWPGWIESSLAVLGLGAAILGMALYERRLTRPTRLRRVNRAAGGTTSNSPPVNAPSLVEANAVSIERSIVDGGPEDAAQPVGLWIDSLAITVEADAGERTMDRLNTPGSPQLFVRAGRRLFRMVERMVHAVSWALEGRSGLLWTLLVLALLLSLLAQNGLGG